MSERDLKVQPQLGVVSACHGETSHLNKTLTNPCVNETGPAEVSVNTSTPLLHAKNGIESTKFYQKMQGGNVSITITLILSKDVIYQLVPGRQHGDI